MSYPSTMKNQPGTASQQTQEAQPNPGPRPHPHQSTTQGGPSSTYVTTSSVYRQPHYPPAASTYPMAAGTYAAAGSTSAPVNHTYPSSFSNRQWHDHRLAYQQEMRAVTSAYDPPINPSRKIEKKLDQLDDIRTRLSNVEERIYLLEHQSRDRPDLSPQIANLQSWVREIHHALIPSGGGTAASEAGVATRSISGGAEVERQIPHQLSNKKRTRLEESEFRITAPQSGPGLIGECQDRRTPEGSLVNG